MMTEKHESRGGRSNGPDPGTGRDELIASLEQRRQTAQGLEQDLLTDVPLLYGSPGRTSEGDPGRVLARLHREKLLRRHGRDVPTSRRRRSDVSLPFERTTVAIIVLFFVLYAFGR